MYGLNDYLANPSLISQPYQMQQVQSAQTPYRTPQIVPQSQEQGGGGGNPMEIGMSLGDKLKGLGGGSSPGAFDMSGGVPLKPELMAQAEQAGPAMQMAGLDMSSLTGGLPGMMGGGAGAAGAGAGAAGAGAAGAGMAGMAGMAGGPVGMAAMLAAPTLLKMFGGGR